MKQKSLRAILGIQIRALRRKRGMTQMQMANELGVSKRYYEGIDRGESNLSLDAVDALANQLDVPAIALLTEDPNDN